MSYGFRTYRSDGSVSVEVTDKMLRVIFSKAVAYAAEGTALLPGFNADNASVYVVSDQSNKRPVWAVMRDGFVEWGYERTWPSAFHSSGQLYVVAKK
ncbi:hypothetical protein [Pseudomonas paralactis]|uniref:hypothetical protein n=1 Tax=Pseudomonas paralactis TaxID=1615673 RepID=UPI0034D460D7